MGCPLCGSPLCVDVTTLVDDDSTPVYFCAECGEFETDGLDRPEPEAPSLSFF